MSVSMIAVDWGSTNLRAKLIVDGALVESRHSAQGIKNVELGNFEKVLFSLCGDWKRDRANFPVVMSGMVGSREGWVEAPYCGTPAGIEDLAAALVLVASKTMGDLLIVPGLRCDFKTDSTDVMRGEEVEVFGVLGMVEGDAVTVCAPGTHSKWVNCRAGKIVSFRTWFTGEAFAKLTQNSLISGSRVGKNQSIDNEAFVRGLERSERSGGLLHHLFLGRTDMLCNRVNPENLPSLISGLLIGHEIREARKFAEGAIQLIGNNQSAQLYGKAFNYFNLPYTQWQQDVHSAGMLDLITMKR